MLINRPVEVYPPHDVRRWIWQPTRYQPAHLECGQLSELLGGEAWLPTGRQMASQPLHRLLTSPRELLADGTGCHPSATTSARTTGGHSP